MMRSLRYWILCGLSIVLFCFVCNAQGFDDLKTAKRVQLNTKLQALLDKNDAKGLEKLLKSKPAMKEEGSRMGKNDKGAPLVIPFFYDVIDRTLKGEVSMDVCQVAINAGCDVNTICNGKTPAYRVMDYLATTPSEQAGVGLQVLELLCSQKDFDINRRFHSLPPPFSYLLSENFNYLGGKYSKDYLSTEIIKTMIDHGARLNTYDENGASLLLLANSTDNEYLQNYLLDNGININKSADASGNNALYAAIESSNVPQLSKILQNYHLFLHTNDVKGRTTGISSEMYDFIAEECAKTSNSYNDLVDFRDYFKDKKNLVQDKYELLARQEVAAASNFAAISRCQSRYPDLKSLTEPKRKAIAEKECAAADSYTALMIFQDRYPDYSELQKKCYAHVTAKELADARTINDVKAFETHYPELSQRIQDKKPGIYKADCQSLQAEYQRALASMEKHSLTATPSYDVQQFVNQYSNYYDPDKKVPLANAVRIYYSAVDVANRQFGPYYTQTNKFEDRYRSDISTLEDVQHAYRKCSEYNLSSSWLSDQLSRKESALRKHYEECCRAVKLVDEITIKNVPKPKYSSSSDDKSNYYFTFDDFSFNIDHYSTENDLHYYVVCLMKGGKLPGFLEGYGSLEEAITAGYAAGALGFCRDPTFYRNGLITIFFDEMQKKIFKERSRQTESVLRGLGL